MTRPRCHHLDRLNFASARLAMCLAIGVVAGSLASGLSGCVRYSSNRDHLERNALVLSPSENSSGAQSSRSAAGVRN